MAGDASDSPPPSTPSLDARLAQIVPLLPGAAFRRLHDERWSMLAVTPGIARVTGHAPEALCAPNGPCLGLLMEPADRASAHAAIAQAIARAEPYLVEYRLRRADGRVCWVLERGERVPAEAGEAIVLEGALEDVTAVHTEREAAARLLHKTFASLSDAVFVIDTPKRVIVQCSPSVEAIFGHSPESLIGRTTFELFPDRATFDAFSRTSVEQLARNGVFHGTGVMQRKDGNVFPTEHTVTLLDPSRGLRGGVVSVVRDLTHRATLQRQLLSSQRLEAVGRLAGGIAHDFNNLLTVMRLNLDLMSDLLPESEEIDEHMEELTEASDRAAALTRQLLAFSRKQLLDPQVVDLNTILVALRKLLDRVIGDNIQLISELSPEPLRVRIDSAQLEQVVMNLVVNARDAMPGGGRIALRTDLSANLERALLVVEDDGTGMPQEVQDRIFEPFFTTKPHDQGTGLGLSTTYGIVRQSGGEITLWSEVGVGSRFTISLPLTSDPESVAPPQDEAPSTSPERATVLLVEDDPPLLRATAKSLTLLGYEVLSAESAARALEAAKHAERVDLVVSDMQLPDLDGVTLIARLRAVRPDLPALLVSGYTEQDRIGADPAALEIAFLAKPFNPEQLARRVAELLRRAPRTP